MGKTGKAIKRRKLAAADNEASQLTTSPLSHVGGDGDDSPPEFLLGLITPSELATTVRTLNTLTRHTELLKNKNDLKALRGAVFDFQRVSATLAGTGQFLRLLRCSESRRWVSTHFARVRGF